VKVEVPAIVGVPEMVLPVKVSSAGRLPAVIDQVYGLVPPVASRFAEYGTVVVPAASDAVVTVTGVVIVIERSLVDVRPAVSVARTVKLAVPAAVGVPEMVLPDKVSPAGRLPAVIDQVYVPVPPVAVRSAE
jgi:hypothetical protein